MSPWRGQYREFAALLPAEGEPWLKVQRVGGEGGVHLDLDVDEPLPVAAERAVRLGAAVVGDLGDVVVCRSPGVRLLPHPWAGRRRRARCAQAPRACSTRSASTSHRGGMPPRSPSGPSSQGGRWTTPTPTTSSRASPGPRGCQCGSSCSGSPRVTGLCGARRPLRGRPRGRGRAPRRPGGERGGRRPGLDRDAGARRAPVLRHRSPPRTIGPRHPDHRARPACRGRWRPWGQRLDLPDLRRRPRPQRCVWSAHRPQLPAHRSCPRRA